MTGRGTSWMPRVLDAPPLTSTLEAEWTKVASVAYTRPTLVVAVLFSAITGVAVAAAAPAALVPTGPAGAGLLGGEVAALLAALWCIATAEYARSRIRLTLLSVPRRGRLLAATVLVRMTAAGAVGVLATLAAVGGGWLVAGLRGVPATSLLEPALLRVAAAAMLAAPFLAVVTVALTFVLRSAATTGAVVLGVAGAPWLVGLLPAGLSDPLLPWLPGSALASLAGTAAPGLALAAAGAMTVLGGWIVVLLGAAYLSLARRGC